MKKNQVPITSFFSSTGKKRSLKEISESQENSDKKTKSENFSSVKQEKPIDVNNPSTAKKKLIIEDEEIDQVYNNFKESKETNNSLIKQKEDENNDIDGYLNPNDSNFNSDRKTNSNQTPNFKQKTLTNSSNIKRSTNTSFDSSIKGTSQKEEKTDKKKQKSNNKKGEVSDDELSESQIDTQNQNLSPEDYLPNFLKYENIRDINKNPPESENYDETTLFVPEEFLKKQTPTQTQFWKIKMHNYDKILFFKLGKFYELFYDDAIIGNKVLELNWMGDIRKLHVGFPEKNLEETANRLVQEGFKVAVIEQTETPSELERRNKDNKTKETTLKREMCNVFTRGTYNPKESDNNYFNRFCIAIVNYTSDQLGIEYTNTNPNSHYFGFIVFEVTTLKFYFGEIIEDDTYNKIQTLFFTVKPEEVIYFRNNLPEYIEEFVKSLSSKPLLNLKKNDFAISKSFNLAKGLFGEDPEQWTYPLNKYLNDRRYSNVSAAFYLTTNFLSNVLLSESLKAADFLEYSEGLLFKSTMTLDFQAISNLEILETNYDMKKPETGSLIEYLNRCATPFGKREFKKWVLNPLTDISKIKDRLKSVEDLIADYDVLSKTRQVMSRYPDFERMCGRIYKSAMQNNSKAVYFEDISKQKLKEFFGLIDKFQESVKVFELLNESKSNFKSETLIQLTTFENSSFRNLKGLVPNITTILADFKNLFIIKKLKDEFEITPQPGVDEDYDECQNRLNEIENEFKKILDEEKKKFKTNLISYTHTKYRYEIEIPEDLIKDKPDGYTMTSNKKGFKRFHTQKIIELLKKLEKEEDALKETVKCLNTFMFRKFYENHKTFDTYIKILSELDCLMNLAVISSQSDGQMCVPEFVENCGPYLKLINMRHPCLSSRIPNFVANDTIIGETKQNEKKTSIVITGPNMGGKSTILRQTCVATIMAQIGCYVPAEKCVLSIVDRIFTRIGARDKILEGKSTFFIEMEETKTIIDHATENSLVIVDELGRGTSTNEGMAIAKSVLLFITNRIKCRTLFTTHYHDLVRSCFGLKGVDLFHMDCNVDKNSNSVNFLYKFRAGVCPESYGINVAKLAGIKESVLLSAKNASEKYREHKKLWN